MKAGIKIMANGGGYTDPSIMIWTPDRKYLFNCGNGLHRPNLSSQSKPYEANTLFLTHLDPETTADLPDYILRNKEDVAIVGPRGLTHSVLSHRYYIGRRWKTMYLTECTNDEQYHLCDGYLSVFPIIIEPTLPARTNGGSSKKLRSSSSSLEKEDLNARNKIPMIEKTSIPLNKIGTLKFTEALDPKNYFEWVLLKGGVLHSDTGNKEISMRDIEQYIVYKSLKLDSPIQKESVRQFKPANIKQIKRFLYQKFSDADELDIAPDKDDQNPFWIMESRSFRLVSRLNHSLRFSKSLKRKMLKERTELFISDQHFGPNLSQAKTFPEPPRANNPKSEICSYICHLPDIIGKFDANKANELGIAGPLRRDLCLGKSVVSPKTNTVIHPNDVLSPSTIGPAILVLACPAVEYLANIVSNPTILSYQTSERSGCIFHMISEALFNKPEYIEFVNGFNSDKWQHVILNESSAYHELVPQSARLFNGLNKVSPMFFPSLAPFSAGAPVPETVTVKNIIRGRFQQQISLNPLMPKTQAPVINDQQCTESVDLDFTFDQKEKQDIVVPNVQFAKEQKEMIEQLTDREMEVVFLGTVCSQTSSHRNESCIYINMFDKGGMLFDVGGGSYSQFYRKYGKEGSERALASLKLIYLSHMHSDHHQGLSKIIQARHKALDNLCIPQDQRAMAVLCPLPGQHYIRDMERSLSLYEQPWNYITFYDSNVHNPQLTNFLSASLAIESYKNIPVIHSFASTGIVIKSKSGWILSYSGDTSYCAEFVKAAKGSTILIHEATFKDAQRDKATSKRHSTFSDALHAASNTNSFMTIFTHFSQRYPKIDADVSSPHTNHHCSSPTTKHEDVQHRNAISMAFDFMSVNIKDLVHLPNSLISIKSQTDDDEDEDIDFDNE
ncbi:hypothetical protein CYY_001013 [Polysphondylium violaceum]|uniref:ribonuclease Z n=1 Tax=Polysphondylium violaceum TaxID=133409 RepID=A0A8J4Q3U8_9MYCE|nr:hypothetical protein CYY_001013 [Polysphondylium violaceum]